MKKPAIVFLFMFLIFTTLLFAVGCSSKVKTAIETGDKAMAGRDFETAVMSYQEAFKLAPKKESVKTKLCKAQIARAADAMDNKKFDIAATSYIEALKLDPGNVELKSQSEKAQKISNFDKYLKKTIPLRKQYEELVVKRREDLADKLAKGSISELKCGQELGSTVVSPLTNLKDQIEKLQVDQELSDVHEVLITAVNAGLQCVQTEYDMIMVRYSEQYKKADNLTRVALSINRNAKMPVRDSYAMQSRTNREKYDRLLQRKASELGLDFDLKELAIK